MHRRRDRRMRWSEPGLRLSRPCAGVRSQSYVGAGVALAMPSSCRQELAWRDQVADAGADGGCGRRCGRACRPPSRPALVRGWWRTTCWGTPSRSSRQDRRARSRARPTTTFAGGPADRADDRRRDDRHRRGRRRDLAGGGQLDLDRRHGAGHDGWSRRAVAVGFFGEGLMCSFQPVGVRWRSGAGRRACTSTTRSPAPSGNAIDTLVGGAVARR